MIPRCNTCGHWRRHSDGEWGVLRGAGECQAAPEIWHVTDSWEDERTGDQYLQLKPEHAKVLSMVADGSSYRAELVTMPDFGCVQHTLMKE